MICVCVVYTKRGGYIEKMTLKHTVCGKYGSIILLMLKKIAWVDETRMVPDYFLYIYLHPQILYNVSVEMYTDKKIIL